MYDAITSIVIVMWSYGIIIVIFKAIMSYSNNYNKRIRHMSNIHKDNNYNSIQQDKKVSEVHNTQQSNQSTNEYFKSTHFSYFNVLLDKGKSGEYKIYNSLSGLPGYKKFIFNCYLPKYNTETTEIDIIMLHRTGIYVFESKNYSGWIFGNEKQENWTQTLYVKYKGTQKNHFYNPILQNNGHIKWLKYHLKEYYKAKYYSYIVFGNDCELKKITITSNQHTVIKREKLFSSILSNIENADLCLTENEIDNIYNRLYKYTQTNLTQKQTHSQIIKSKYK